LEVALKAINLPNRLTPWLPPLIAIALACLTLAMIIALAGANPLSVFTNLWQGAFGSPLLVARIGMTFAPLILCASGLLFTFATGIYNLGIEGQIAMGAIVSLLPIRLWANTLPPSLVILLALVFGAIGGLSWGLFAGSLNVFGRINEIFAGLGLNFVADGLALYLIFGPWKRPGVASMSGTEPFAETLWLPTLGNTQTSPVALILALLAFAFTLLLLRGTYWGLQWRAIGQNPQAAYIQGIPAQRQLLNACMLCGLMAGLAGALQVLAVFHRLIPNISSNLGYLALLVAMLSGRWLWGILPIAFFFSALNVGSLQLPLVLNLESSLAGVIQGLLVLFVLLGRGWQKQAPRI
jgi:general nucleoside transport system permease protein